MGVDRYRKKRGGEERGKEKWGCGVREDGEGKEARGGRREGNGEVTRILGWMFHADVTWGLQGERTDGYVDLGIGLFINCRERLQCLLTAMIETPPLRGKKE